MFKNKMTFYKILSLNILCGTFFFPIPILRFKKQIKKIIELDPEIICLQEFNNFVIEYFYKKYLSSEYNFIVFRISLIEFFRRISLLFSILLLSLYTNIYLFLFMIVCIINPYFFNFFLGNQETGNAILVKKKISFKNPSMYKFINQYGDCLNIIRYRGFLKLQINDFTVVNTHLNNSNYSQPQIIELLNQCTENKIIICGDLNTDQISLFKIYGFNDCTSHLGFTYRNENPLVPFYIQSKVIDYIFYKHVFIIHSEKKDIYSDHDGLLMTFRSCSIYTIQHLKC